ncbi:hypothetical protein I4F81_000329 [Pyropia yezoensis]|uniref:Uncharacterized protein n=1 Tax=Pyropia yezoensis TaxID=2788 RepID=A0ACC3BIF0_PYRYE|nr:hypothetical protein I4F81_000329 [Neopyropia yezoensis]
MAPAAGSGRGKGPKRAHDAALAASNASVIAEKAAVQADRMKYLLSQSKLFRHFLGDARASPPPAAGAAAAATSKKGAAAAAAKDAPDSATKRRRLTEKEEDAQLLRTEEAALPPTTRLSVQPSNIKGEMRPYQLEGLNFLISLFERGVNGILADEMGLGKTLQTISLLGFLRQYKNITGPHLVIVPKSTLGNWMNEFGRWCPDIRPVRFHGDQEARRHQMEEELVFGRFDVCVTTKAKTEIVSQLHAVLRPFLIRRHKTEVETSLPPKTETVLFTWLTPMQLDLYRNLLRKDGRLATTKNVNKDELLDMVRCGADKFFSAKAGEFEDEDLDAILARGQRKTKELNDDLSARAAAAAETGNLSLLDLTLDGRTAPGGTGSVYNFQGENFAPGAAGGGGGAAGDHFFLDVGKRSRVRTYDENALAGVGVNGGMSAAEVAASRARAKFKTLKYKVPKLDDHQLFNTARLKELFAAERAIVDAYNERVEAEPLLSPAEEAEKQQLVRSGFANWTRREFNGFVRGCERHGRTAIAAIAAEVGSTKTAADVQLYAAEFWRRGPTTLDTWPRLAKSIEEGEAKLERRRRLDLALTNKGGSAGVSGGKAGATAGAKTPGMGAGKATGVGAGKAVGPGVKAGAPAGAKAASPYVRGGGPAGKAGGPIGKAGGPFGKPGVPSGKTGGPGAKRKADQSVMDDFFGRPPTGPPGKKRAP